ncbi:hypothetical protein Vau01_077820 [Virgisporangium aurantiacum]|uniref:Uncharacterized protein n=1 Tax=Virgisporangium aurantiacum TaxID=175570 RepID=A0A8J4E3M2_9ACTN|nr:hypothetical protein Vau01_077820 [Virgisporangium aurantiacum]
MGTYPLRPFCEGVAQALGFGRVGQEVEAATGTTPTRNERRCRSSVSVTGPENTVDQAHRPASGVNIGQSGGPVAVDWP